MVNKTQSNLILTGMIRSGSTFLGGTLNDLLPNHAYFREPGNSENYIKKGSLFEDISLGQDWNTVYLGKSAEEKSHLTNATIDLLTNPMRFITKSKLTTLRGLKYLYLLAKYKLSNKLIIKDPTIPFIVFEEAILNKASVYFTIRHPHSFILSVYNNYRNLEGMSIEKGLEKYFSGIERILLSIDPRVTVLVYEEFTIEYNAFLYKEFGLITDYNMERKSKDSLGWGYVGKKVVYSDIPTQHQVEETTGIKLKNIYDINTWKKYYDATTFD